MLQQVYQPLNKKKKTIEKETPLIKTNESNTLQTLN